MQIVDFQTENGFGSNRPEEFFKSDSLVTGTRLFLIKLVIGVSVLVLSGLIGLGGFFIIKSNNVLGIVSPLSEEERQREIQYQVVFGQKTIDFYPPNEYFPIRLEPKWNPEIDINAQAFAVMDRGSGELLIAKNLTQELPIASTTKIMTALLALEKADLDLELKVSSSAASVGESVMGLTAGEIVTVEQLLYGLILPSGNDAAETLAEGLQGGKSGFLLAMNRMAQELSMFDTFFFNPSGLDGNTYETTNFSTALDMLALTNYALNNPKFAEIVSTHKKIFDYVPGKHKAFVLYNRLQLEESFPGIKGVKPGVTNFAGETLVSYAENGGKELIVVLLGTQNTRDEVVKIYEYLFPKLGVNVEKKE